MFRAALGFFTRLPIGSAPLPPTFRGVVVWLPVVGMLVGGITALALTVFTVFFPPVLCGVLGCVVWTAITGGLHLDGVADCGDGLFVEVAPARRLEIMRDSRLGTFGGVALFFTLTLKAGALGALAASVGDAGFGARFFALAGVCALAGGAARALVFWAMRVPSARPGGLGEALHEGVTPQHERRALLIVFLLCVVNGVHGVLAVGAAVCAAWFLLSAARKRLGGVTGDVFGCLIETAEWVILLVSCAL